MFLTLDDAQLRTVSFGPGPRTVLALNGWSASWEAWEPTFSHLSTDRRCISFDTRGTGSSTTHPESISMATLVDDVFRVLDARDVERCVLAGESLGGFVAMHAALRDPARFSALVLVATPPMVHAESVGQLVAGARADYPATIRAFVRSCLDEDGTDPAAGDLHRWGASLFLGADPEVAARLFECCYGLTVDPARIAVPTTVVHGSDDAVVPVAAGRYLASVIPGARYVELTGAGHAPTVTRGAEMAEILRSVHQPMPAGDPLS